jgi:hypothetical protein
MSKTKGEIKLCAVLLALVGVFGIESRAFADNVSEAAAADLLRKRMKNERPEDLAILNAVKGKDIVVVRGSMDHIEQVLSAARIRHQLVSPAQVSKLDLNADQILMVNCPGNMPAAGVRRIERFVRAGGLLYTTDWALLNVIQKAFPGTIAHNGQSTGDHVTPVHVHGKDDNMMSSMLLRDDAQPQWWLEGGSYPIRIIDHKRVKVLASSREMKRRYGSAPVVVRFRWDDGEVIHVVSHFYRQIGTEGPAVASGKSVDSFKGLTKAQKKEFKNSPLSAASVNDVASSYAFQQMTSNMVVGKSRSNVSLDRVYKFALTKPLKIGGRQAQAGQRVKLIKRKGKKAVIRDDRGVETECDFDELRKR